MTSSGRRRGLRSVENRRDDKLARLDPGAFEALIATHFRGQGYSVERVGHGGDHFDGGIDLKLRRGSEYVVVQCKRENAYQVTHNVGHELIGVMCTQGASGAIVVNSGEFTEYARRSALGDARLILVDGDEVRRWFPELAVPVEGSPSEWVAVGDGPTRRVQGSPAGGEGLKFALGVVVLAALALWQCNRPDPHADFPVGSSKPALAPRVPVSAGAQRAKAVSDQGAVLVQTQAPVIQEPTAKDMADWKRRNAESMDILSDSTPELDLAPAQ